MQQVVIKRPGGLKRLEVVEAPRPEVGEHQVLVKAHAIGVNFADCVIRLGLYPAVKDYAGYPITPGFECSGEVIEVGTKVNRFHVGQRVFGVTRFGAYQEYVLLEEQHAFACPPSLSLLEAGAFTVASLTAYYALFELGALSEGQTLLVHSAAGGVGSALCQLAVARGTQVVAVVSSEPKAQFVRSLGVDEVVVHPSGRSSRQLSRKLKERVPDGFHLICDANGYSTLKMSYRLLRPMGRLVVYGAHTMLKRGGDGIDWPRLIWTFLRTPRFSPLELTNDNKTLAGFNLSYLFDDGAHLLAKAMTELLKAVEHGTLKVPEIESIPLSRVADAHRLIQSGRSRGKIVLVPDHKFNA